MPYVAAASTSTNVGFVDDIPLLAYAPRLYCCYRHLRGDSRSGVPCLSERNPRRAAQGSGIEFSNLVVRGFRQTTPGLFLICMRPNLSDYACSLFSLGIYSVFFRYRNTAMISKKITTP